MLRSTFCTRPPRCFQPLYARIPFLPPQLQSVTKSDFHLYVGSSVGRVIVFALGRVCQRPEKHRCHLHDEPQWFCEQVRLSVVTGGDR